ncbi:NAD(P)H-dependent glycerol-3-phosphate dehydrogenase [Thiohalorhabdus sp. Cl-TMA]|uniref:Glycerol-3-phosphate dehydrogenase [NAD(P)+] n=1 Tax=Thiohalorhabdus methylotrophus TaxID=3242694 RepID=A0ABV4TVR6_9GAMM
MAKAAVMGAGAWGTALAIHLARCGFEVLLWDRDQERAAAAQQARENEAYLPGVPLPDGVTVSADLSRVAGVPSLVLAVPSAALREVAGALKPYVDGGTWAACATKGLEEGSGKLMHEVLVEVLGDRLGGWAILSGPSFADEVGRGLPTAITVAQPDAQRAEKVAAWFRCDPLRVYTSDDPVGVELGGAVKNVIAIAAGIADGMGLGYNARAALITRGLAEMSRLGVAMGGHAETFAGLTGLGDLVLTCTGPLSRNHQLGEVLGQGTPVDRVSPALWRRAEGVRAARALHGKAAGLGVDMPITEQVYRVLCEGEDPRRAVRSLMQRTPKAERPLDGE